jgi:replicative DNA helicase
MTSLEITGLPQAIELERLVLGALQIDPEAQDGILSALEPDDFAREDHRRIFLAALEVRNAGDSLDRVTIAHRLIAKGQLDSVGGLAYLADLDNDLPQLYGLDSYVKKIREKAILRRAVLTCSSLMERLSAPEATLAEIRAAEELMRTLAAKGESGSGLRSMAEFFESHSMADFLDPSRLRATVVPSPFAGLNAMLAGGFRPGQLVVLAARPGIGKSACASAFALEAARAGCGVAFFSLEMSAAEVWQRMTASCAEVSLSALTKGNLSDSYHHAAMFAMTNISEMPVHVDDTTGSTVPALIGALRKHNAKLDSPVKLVIVDYLQLLSSTWKKQNRTEEVSGITRDLKLAARELKVPILVLSQLSREMDKQDREPELHDLRESGSIEQDADVVMFLHQTAKDKRESFEQRCAGRLRLLVKKQRNGPIGGRDLLFHAKYMRLEEVDGYGD